MSFVLRDFVIRMSSGFTLRVPEMEIREGHITGITGGRGSGKSALCQCLLGMGERDWSMNGEFSTGARQLLSGNRIAVERGRDVCWIGSDPRSLLDPLQRCGTQLVDAYLATHAGSNRGVAVQNATDILSKLGIDDPRRRMRNFPHEISGGMAQRLVIAAALLTHAALVILDDALVGLDATLEMQIVGLLRSLNQSLNQAILFVSHDPLLTEYASTTVYFISDGYVRPALNKEPQWQSYKRLVTLEGAE